MNKHRTAIAYTITVLKIEKATQHNTLGMNIALLLGSRSGQSAQFNIGMAFLARSVKVIRLVRSCKSSNFETTFRSVSNSSSLHGRVVPFKLSDIGEGIREVTVKEWFVKPGDKVNQFDNVCEVQSDKASVTITSRYDGFIKALRFEVDEIALVGQPLVDIELHDDEESADKFLEEKQSAFISSQEEPNQSTLPPSSDDKTRDNLLGKVLTTPAVRRIAMEKGIRLKDVVGTGKHGRILKEDLISHEETDASDNDVKELKQEKIIKTKTSVPKAYAKHMWTTMTRSLSIPHFVYSDECDVTKLVHLRNEVKAAFKERGLALTYMPFFIKALSKSLEKFPELNAILNENSQTADISPSHNISIAMDTPQGLVVPNVKNVQNLDIISVARELNRLQKLGEKASIPLSDLSGGTFTLSNVGMIGGTYTKPVILSPQIAIGAIGKIQKLPRFDTDGKVVAVEILTVSWSADHRVVDGVTIAKFSNQWKYYLENPSLLVMNG